jgi:5-methylcytosine-specific restriction endonuclease McrA
MVPRAERGSRRYLNYFDGEVKVITDREYQERLKLINIDEKVKFLFKDSELVVRKINSSNTSSKDVYEIYNAKFDKYIYVSAMLVKNSGVDNSRKRLQVFKDYFGHLEAGEQRLENKSYFFLGFYPIDSKGNVIYILLDNDGVSLNPLNSYSSLWVDFDAIKSTVANGIYFGINKRNANKYVSFTIDHKSLILDALEHDDYSSIVKNNEDLHVLDDDGAETDGNFMFVEDYLPSRDAVVTIEGKAKIRKNAALRELAFLDAHYTCALCGKKHTFVTNNSKMYFEAHHLIPCNINIQRRFVKKLDHNINLFCLCPECHRKIHLINNREVGGLVEKLYKEREREFDEIYNLKLNDLIDIYTHIDRRDEANM